MSKIKPNAGSDSERLSFADLSFESAMTELESIVGEMETNQLPLEQSLSSYKRGTELLHFCQKMLADVEQQVRILNESNQLNPHTDNDD